MNITVDNEIYKTNDCEFIADLPSFTQYLKGKYNDNFERCKSRLIVPLIKQLKRNEQNNHIHTVAQIANYWNVVEKFTYLEAFNISNDIFRVHVFSSINIKEMIDNLGAVRIGVEGIELVNKKYCELISKFNYEDYSYVVELYKVDGAKLKINDNLYVVKIWCTSTNEEHWLWVDENNFDINSPLDAIASTCIIYRPMQDKIKHIIRQGDVFLFEMLEDVNINPNDEIIRLSKDDYFNLLKSQA